MSRDTERVISRVDVANRILRVLAVCIGILFAAGLGTSLWIGYETSREVIGLVEDVKALAEDNKKLTKHTEELIEQDKELTQQNLVLLREARAAQEERRRRDAEREKVINEAIVQIDRRFVERLEQHDRNNDAAHRAIRERQAIEERRPISPTPTSTTTTTRPGLGVRIGGK